MNIYQIITLYILHLHNVTCQLYLNKAGIKTTANAPRIQVTGSKWDFIQVHSLQRSCLYHLWSIHWKFPLIYHLSLPSSALIACLSSITYFQGKHVNFSFNAFSSFKKVHTDTVSSLSLYRFTLRLAHALSLVPSPSDLSLHTLH